MSYSGIHLRQWERYAVVHPNIRQAPDAIVLARALQCTLKLVIAMPALLNVERVSVMACRALSPESRSSNRETRRTDWLSCSIRWS